MASIKDISALVASQHSWRTLDELLIWARPLLMVVDHRNKTPETMEVFQNEWEAKGLVKIAPFHRSIEIKWLKRKLEMLTVEPDDTTVQKIDLEMKITRLESETLEKTQTAKGEGEDEEGGSATAKGS
jgi:hypothetical protein